MKTTTLTALLALIAVPALAQTPPPASLEALEKAVAAAWPNQPPDMQARLDQDETAKLCSATRNAPSADAGKALMAREAKGMVYPPDGNFMGDWKQGEKIALDGFGLRMGDDPKRANGGNCYACHQLSPKEISYGTLGPSLMGYGKLKDYKPEAVKAAYEKIFNAQTTQPCSIMPRLGHNKVLTIEQIKDAVAFLMSPDSPVNK